MAETNTKPNTNPNPRFSGAPGGAPGQAPQDRRRKRRSAASEYKKSLQEKQELKRLYGLSEKQFKKYVTETLERRHKVENVSEELIKRLEKRLDNVIFRLGLAKSRSHSRQMVSHAFFTVNGKAVNIPSFQVNKGDVIALKELKKKKTIFNDVADKLKKIETPVWLKLDKQKIQAEVAQDPTLAEANPPVEISLIFEFYSR